jgi:hypothetical protein
MPEFTKKDAKDMGIPLTLLNKWKFVMDSLWSFLVSYSKAEKKVNLSSESNTIFFQLNNRCKFKICVLFLNNAYLCLSIKIIGHDDFEANISHIDEFGNKGLISVVSDILTFADNIK